MASWQNHRPADVARSTRTPSTTPPDPTVEDNNDKVEAVVSLYFTAFVHIVFH